jgi:hypothetical protein
MSSTFSVSSWKGYPSAPVRSTIPHFTIVYLSYGLAVGGSRYFKPGTAGVGLATEYLINVVSRPELFYEIQVTDYGNLVIRLTTVYSLAYPFTTIWQTIPLYPGIVNRPPAPIIIPAWDASFQLVNTGAAVANEPSAILRFQGIGG